MYGSSNRICHAVTSAARFPLSTLRECPQNLLHFGCGDLQSRQRCARDMNNETANAGEQRLRTISQADATREISRRDEYGGAVAGLGCGDGAVLSEGEQRR